MQAVSYCCVTQYPKMWWLETTIIYCLWLVRNLWAVPGLCFSGDPSYYVAREVLIWRPDWGCRPPSHVARSLGCLQEAPIPSLCTFPWDSSRVLMTWQLTSHRVRGPERRHGGSHSILYDLVLEVARCCHLIPYLVHRSVLSLHSRGGQLGSTFWRERNVNL